MYKIIHDGKKSKTTYETYEAARLVVRKKLRKLDMLRRDRQPVGPFFWFGFSIKKVN